MVPYMVPFSDGKGSWAAFYMSQFEKLFDKAQGAQKNFHFTDLIKLAEIAGFELKRQKGSHMWFQNPNIHSIESGISLQEGENGKAKPYQVRQLLNLIEKYQLYPK